MTEKGDADERPRTRRRTADRDLVAFMAGLVLGFVALLAWGFGRTSLSGWGVVQAILTTVIAGALVSAPWVRAPRPRIAGGIAAALFALVCALRIASAGENAHARSVVLPAGGSGRWVNRLFEERDAAIVGAWLMASLGILHSAHRHAFAGLLEARYAVMEADSPGLGTPVPATYLGLEGAGGFDAYHFRGASDGTVAYVFLHGYAGGFALWCWEIARAVRDVPADVWCPSMGPTGFWWTHDGRVIAERTIEAVRAAGAERVVLVGLSNGGYGASRLASDLPIDALVLLCGVDDEARAAGVPTIVVHGRGDDMFLVEHAERYAERTGARLVLLEGTHFLLLEQPDAIGAALRDAASALNAP